MENILSKIEKQNLEDLYKLKYKAYNHTLNDYITIINQVKNLRYENKIYLNDFDLATILFGRDLDCENLQKNIEDAYNYLKLLNDDLKNKLDDLSEMIAFCDNYLMLNKEEKIIFDECYIQARYIQTLCITDLYKTFPDDKDKVYLELKKEIRVGLLNTISKKIFKIFKAININKTS